MMQTRSLSAMNIWTVRISHVVLSGIRRITWHSEQVLTLVYVASTR